MRNEIDFLPPKHRVVRSKREGLRWSIWFAVTVVCAIVLTDVVLRYRLQGLRELRVQAQRDSDTLAWTNTRIDKLEQVHYDTLQELAAWSTPPTTIPPASTSIDQSSPFHPNAPEDSSMGSIETLGGTTPGVGTKTRGGSMMVLPTP